MRNRALHAALRDFALEAAACLSRAVAEGEELRFALDEEPGARGGVLYRYRPLTDEYIDARWEDLRALASARRAIAALGSGARAYLRLHGLGGADAEPALRALLERLYEDAIGFGFPEERFERLYAEVEQALYDGTTRATVVAPLFGLELDAGPVELGEGLSLVGEDGRQVPDDAVRARRRGELGDPAAPVAYACLERDLAGDEPLPIDEARVRFRGLVTGLRLFAPGGLALSAVGWARLDEGAARPCAIGSSAHPRGETYMLDRADVPRLRTFLGSLAAARATGPIGWALDRFELGCERERDTDAVSDHLLALRALLDGADEAGAATMSLRLAALCADQADRRAVQRTLELALALERFAIGGSVGKAYAEQVGPASPRAVVDALEDHLRTLLRDVLCGLVDPNLRAVADDILLARGEPIEITARDMRRFRRDGPAAEPAPGADDDALRADAPADEPAPAPAQDPLPTAVTAPAADPAEADTGEMEALRMTTPPRSQLAAAPPAGAPAQHTRRFAPGAAEPSPAPDAAIAVAEPERAAGEPARRTLWRAAAPAPEPAELWSEDAVEAGVTPSTDWDEGGGDGPRG